MAEKNTKQSILDAAERLFALHGYHHTSLRKITGEAGVNLAAVNYHFGSKEALLKAIFERHLIPLNKIRQDNIKAVRELAQREKKPLRAADIIRAFIEPTLKYRDSKNGSNYFIALVGRAMTEPDDTVRNLFLHHIKPLGFLLFETLKEALPDLNPETLYWRLQFTVGTISHIMRTTGRLEMVPDNITLNQDADSLIDQLLPFLTAGLEAP
ncbi:MAG: TetR/AcrR family transcriptional regulator [Pseudomonadota bacterium]|nr:TetR/AcrR family transcriptional regulator [Pseudomonadota bacterium]